MALGSKEQAAISQRFFKTGPGEYGEGDIFLGIKVPVLRKLATEYSVVSLKDVKTMLGSKYHEERLLSLFIMVDQFSKGDQKKKKSIYELYLKNTRFINNWDLVDSSAHRIVGPYLMDESKALLYELAQSVLMWERRIAIMSTFHYIKNDTFTDTLKIARMLLSDKEDLIHKAVGWMLREIGKRHLQSEETFLIKHYHNMPRTMLRYAIEKFPEPKRQRYLKGQI
ncbi:probable DNA alkylation repair enzyme [Olavius sp. associated proteobacterium Delta 1]|nr:probable DNA alkylation repair enzyme [Olavius sp. associated proteobacterium Delta 1]